VGSILKEISKLEQRYEAVLSVIRDGLSVTETAEKFGVSRQSLYRWMDRYEIRRDDGRSHAEVVGSIVPSPQS